MKSISDIRKEYKKLRLDISTINKDPLVQFAAWFDEALNGGALEPNAMTLATISERGNPSSRIVLLKGVEEGKFLFYTNYQSQKGRELEAHPECALNFFWPELERQVRIEGVAEKVDQQTSEKYFQSRPRTSQVGAWVSPQSAIIASREILEARTKVIEEKFKGKDVLPKPNQWGGYAVTPLYFEFWQGRESRLHDRVVYSIEGKAWGISRLAP